MLAYCGRPRSASFCDRFPSIEPRYARETIAETCSIWVALATAIITHPGSQGGSSHQLWLRHPTSSLPLLPSGPDGIHD
jgi:hypothetical protein